MIEGLFNQPNYVASKRMLDVTVLRHQALAANLANVETPGYKRIDVAQSFRTELSRAVAARDVSQLASLAPRLEQDASAIAGRDGNSVQLETELMNLQQNSVAHTLETQLISGALLKMRMAITGRAS